MAGKHKGKSPNGPKELTAQRDEDIWSLRTTQMLTQQQIADRFGINQATVSISLQRTAARKSKDLDKRVEVWRESLMEKLDQIISDTYQAWHKAQNPGPDDPRPNAANAKYLDTNIKAIERLCKMLGIDAPSKIEQSRSAGSDVIKEIDRLKEED